MNPGVRAWPGGAASVLLAGFILLFSAHARLAGWYADADLPLLGAVVERWRAPWTGGPIGLAWWVATPAVGDPYPRWILLLTAACVVAVSGVGVLAGRTGRGTAGLVALAALGLVTWTGTFQCLGPMFGIGLGALAVAAAPLDRRGLGAGVLTALAAAFRPEAGLLVPVLVYVHRGRSALPALVLGGIVPDWRVLGPAPLAALALTATLPGPRAVRAAAAGLAAAITLLGFAPAMVVLGALAAAKVGWGARLPGVWVLLELGVILAGGDRVGLGLAVALQVAAAIATFEAGWWRAASWVVSLLIVAPTVSWRVAPVSPARDRLLGLSALVSAMGPSEAVLLPPTRPSDGLLSMTGFFPREQLARPAAVSIGDSLLLNPPPDAVERNLLARSRVAPSSVPWLGDDARALEERMSEADHPRSIPSGWYAIGLMPAVSGGRTFGSVLHAIDGCGNRWTATSPASDVAIALEVVPLRDECPGLTLAWTGEPNLQANFILAPLDPDPVLSAARGR